MKKYFTDTNIILRYILNDNQQQATHARNIFVRAKSGEIQLILKPFIVLEVDYVLKKVYRFSKETIITHLSVFIKSAYITVHDRNALIIALSLYKEYTMDLADTLLFALAKKEQAGVLSFDKDFKKLENISE